MIAEMEVHEFWIDLKLKSEVMDWPVSNKNYSHFFYDEQAFDECIEILGCLENIRRECEFKHLHASHDPLKVYAGKEMTFFFDGDDHYLQTSYFSVEMAVAYRDAYYEMTQNIADAIGTTMPHISWFGMETTYAD